VDPARDGGAVTCPPSERALTFGCGAESLMAIVHLPAVPANLGVVVVVGGPQYRAGSHRQFVLLSRAIAAAGFAVLRFDARGMGDSAGAARGFEDIGDDIAAAIDALQTHAPTVHQVVLWGLCDGASAALLYVDATRDPRIAGVCALNPWARSDVSLARTHLKHYYGQRLWAPEFWAKLVRGQVGFAAVRELSRKVASLASRAPPADGGAEAGFAQRMAGGCEALSRGGVLLMLSDNDYTAREFSEYAAASSRWRRVMRSAHVQSCKIDGADHTVSQPAARVAVDDATVRWLGALQEKSLHAAEASGA
jgi:uncharacterized protein